MWMQELKQNIINRYKKLIDDLSTGKQYDYSDIINMICLLETHQYFPNTSMIINSFYK